MGMFVSFLWKKGAELAARGVLAVRLYFQKKEDKKRAEKLKETLKDGATENDQINASLDVLNSSNSTDR